MTAGPLGGDLLARTAELVDIPSVSHDEKRLADRVESVLGGAAWLHVDRLGDNVIARTTLGRPTRVILAGHLDTVSPNGNDRARHQDGRLWGLGAADMKGGLAVMLDLAVAMEEPEVDVSYVFYVCEEVASEHSGLIQIERDRPDLLAGDVAILGEPTGGRVEAGCQGSMRLRLVLGGQRAHTARPWMGVNAVHRLAPILDSLGSYQSRRPVLDGCEYREALQAVRVEGGVAGNVVPDRVTVTINHRFAPDRAPAEAYAAVSGMIRPLLDEARGDRLELGESAPGALPGLAHPILAALVAATGSPPRAKLGWTDVAFFSARGIPATNYGPGDPELAHTAGEYVTAEELQSARSVLGQLLGEI